MSRMWQPSAKPTALCPEGGVNGVAGLSGIMKLVRDRDEDSLVRSTYPMDLSICY